MNDKLESTISVGASADSATGVPCATGVSRAVCAARAGSAPRAANTSQTIDSTDSIDSEEQNTCIVRAHYDGQRRNPLPEVSKESIIYIIDNNENMLDFLNLNPDRTKIDEGCGFVVEVLDSIYIVTCSHIVVRSASRYTAHFSIDQKTVCCNLEVHCRIPELDIAIMKPSNSDIIKSVPKIVIDRQCIQDYLAKRIDLERSIRTSEIPGTIAVPCIKNGRVRIERTEFDSFEIVHSQIITSLINSVPNISIPVESLDIFDDIEEKYGKTIKDIGLSSGASDGTSDGTSDGKSDESKDKTMLAEIIARIKGFSGSLVRIDGAHAGIVMTIDMEETDRGMICSIKVLPIDIVLTIVDNSVRRHMTNIMGVQIDYGVFEASEDGHEFHVISVLENSNRYTNGMKDFWFTKGDIVLSMDQMDFAFNGRDNVLEFTPYGTEMPINAYALCKANFDPNTEIGVTIPRMYDRSQKRITFNIMPVPYNDMYTIRIYHSKEIYWHGFLFVELSEEMIRFYESIGMELLDSHQHCRTSANGEKIVLLFNYDSRQRRAIDMSYARTRYPSTDDYRKVVQANQKDGKYYFYHLEKVSSRNVSSLDDLHRIIKQIGTTKQKKVTLQIKGSDDVAKLLLRV